MGKFIYEGGSKVELEDRAITHVQLVVTAKLRRGEPFPFPWREDASAVGGNGPRELLDDGRDRRAR